MSADNGDITEDTIVNRNTESPEAEGEEVPSKTRETVEEPVTDLDPPPSQESPDLPTGTSGSPEPLIQNEKDEEGNTSIVVVNLSEKRPKDDDDSDSLAKEDISELQKKELDSAVVGEEDKEEEKPKVKAVAVWRLFSYATALDWILMLIGTVCAILHGGALPGFVIIFGQFLNVFFNQAITNGLTFLTSNGTALVGGNGSFDCSNLLNPDAIGLEFFTIDQEGSPCNFTVLENSTLSSVLTICYNAMCLDNVEFIHLVNIGAYQFLGVAASIFVFATIQIAFFQAACERQVKKIRLAFYRAIMSQEIGWFDANPSSELSSRIADDVDKIHDGIGDKVALLIQWVATFFGGFIVAFIYSWELTLVLVAFSPLLVIAGGLVSRFTSQFSSQEQKQYASAGGVAEEVLSSIRTVVAFGGEKVESARYDGKLKEARAFGAKKGFTVGFSSGFIFFVFFSLDAVAFWVGAYLLTIDRIEAGEIFIVFFGVLIGAFALGQAGPNVEVLLTAAGAGGAIFEVIDRQSLIDPMSEEGEKPKEFDGSIEFKDIFFSYPTRPDVEVLDGFNLTVEVGKTYALVGSSGCGKSTVIQLLQRFYDPNAGEVLVGGKDIRTLNTKWLRQNIGVVSQEPVLFDATIAENILYGNEDATQEEMKAAAVNANAHDFISQLPDGYKTQVGEGGTQLSGGQKQRVAIARALVRNPKILLLDEATSALDTQSESVVQQALDRARAGRTTIVIAHRLSTIQNADVIASVKDGRIVEKGSHLELMDNEGLYCELVTAQSYGIDEGFTISSPQRLLSHRGSRRGHGGSESESSTGVERQLSYKKQTSIHKQPSLMQQQSSDGTVAKVLTLKEKEEMWDKDIPEVSFIRTIKKNSPEWWIIILGLLGAFVNGAIFPSFALFFGEVLKVLGLPTDQVLRNIHPWAALFIVLGIVSGVAIFCKITCFTIAGENLTSRLRSLSFKAMLRQEIGWYDEERNSSGSLTTRLADDAAKVQGATGSRLGTLLETSVSMLISIIVAFAYSWVLTFLILAVVPIVLIAGALEVKALSGHTIQNKKSLESAGKIAVDSISNIRTVASLSLEKSFNAQYAQNVEKPFKKAMLNTIVYGLTYSFSQAAIYIMYAVVFRFGSYQILLPADHIANARFDQIFVVFFALVFGAAGAGQAGAFAPNYAKAKLSVNRIFHLLDRVPIIDTYSEEGTTLENVSGTIDAQELKFNYPSRPDVEVLQGLNISVKSGETLALVGPSGCGKSTVVSLLERFYNPLSGVLNLDGTNISDMNISWVRRQIGVVSQEPVLFDRSIADNIRYGANYREVSSEEVIEAAKAANIHSFVESLPQGYNTNVGAKGTQLSGGQKQRIAIARALVRDPRIILLDEATSALDTESEKIVQEALDKARVGRTSIVIAHRLSTIFNSDCIAVISDGKVVEKGTHKELIDLKGLYYKLNRFQMVPG